MTPTKTGFLVRDLVSIDKDDRDHGCWRITGLKTGRVYTRALRSVDDLHEILGQALEAEQDARR
jgi:hypothetical protein